MNQKSAEDLEAQRLKRNKRSRQWKKAHPGKVRAWNQAWALEQAGDKEAAGKLRSAVRDKKAPYRSSPAAEANADVKRVVVVAAEYLKSLLGEISTLRLEEVEKKKDGLGWLVTLSFVPPVRDQDLSFLSRREYKQVEINASGQPVAMRIKKFE